jgi:hypothetical protein
MDKFEKIDDILDMEISEETASHLTEALVAWKEEYAATLEERNSEVLEEKIQELEELNERWREEMAEEYSDRYISALSEMRDEVKANVLAEYVDTDPTHRVMEEIKRLVAPTIDEEYTKNVYLEELLSLRDQVEGFKKKMELEEGRRTLEELIESYDDRVKPLLREFIGEGSAEEVEEKFYKLVTSLNEDEDEDEDFDFDDEDDEDDFDWDDEDFDLDDEDFDEDFSDDEYSSIFEEFEEDGDASGVGPRRRAILDLVK